MTWFGNHSCSATQESYWFKAFLRFCWTNDVRNHSYRLWVWTVICFPKSLPKISKIAKKSCMCRWGSAPLSSLTLVQEGFCKINRLKGFRTCLNVTVLIWSSYETVRIRLLSQWYNYWRCKELSMDLTFVTRLLCIFFLILAASIVYYWALKWPLINFV